MDILSATSPVTQTPTLVPLFAALAGAVIGGSLTLLGGYWQRAQDRRNAYADKVAEVSTVCYQAHLSLSTLNDAIQRTKDGIERANTDADALDRRNSENMNQGQAGTSQQRQLPNTHLEERNEYLASQQEDLKSVRREADMAMFLSFLYLPKNIVDAIRVMRNAPGPETESQFIGEARRTVEKARLNWLRRRAYKQRW